MRRRVDVGARALHLIESQLASRLKRDSFSDSILHDCSRHFEIAEAVHIVGSGW